MVTDNKPLDKVAMRGLERLLAAALEADPACEAFNDERFVEWLLNRAHARKTPAERAENGRAADDFARRMRPRMIAERIRATMPVHELRVRESPVICSIADAITRAGGEYCAPWMESSQVAAGMGRDLWDEPCERWVELPERTRRGQNVALSVHGDSMIPLLEPHDVIVVKIGAPAKAGSIVVAEHPSYGYVGKHVASVNKSSVELESLNPEYTSFRTAPDPRLIVGRVTHILRPPD